VNAVLSVVREGAVPMMYDDDTGRRPYFPIQNEDRVSNKRKRKKKGSRSTRLPSANTQQLILELAQHPGWQAELIHAYLRHKYNRHDVSLNTIRDVLAQGRAHRRS
jgi:hypothetical protein